MGSSAKRSTISPFLPSLLTLALLSLAGCSAGTMEGAIAPRDSSAWHKCGSATKVHVTPPQSTVTVSYTEPTTGTDGKPLANLERTTIYYNAGDGPVIAKVVAASSKKGGGSISQPIVIRLPKPEPQDVTVCVTATDTDGREGPASP